MKYEFTGETKIVLGVTLRRIRAVVAIAAIGVAAGQLGGWIEKEGNLAQVYGNAWVYGDARVSKTLLIATRTDGYTFAIFTTSAGPRITAGCRFFTPAEARKHWRETRGGTPLGGESLQLVKHLVAMHKIQESA